MIIETVFVLALWNGNTPLRRSEHPTLDACTAAIAEQVEKRQAMAADKGLGALTDTYSCFESRRVVVEPVKAPSNPRAEPAPRPEYKDLTDWWRRN